MTCRADASADGGASFAEPAAGCSTAIEGIERIRYTSPHPKDMREDVIRAHAELASVCEHIHLPLQSGSSRILKAMRRTYDRERYLDRVAMIREHLPDVALTTDIIVGFPGETEEDFQQTLEVVRAGRLRQRLHVHLLAAPRHRGRRDRARARAASGQGGADGAAAGARPAQRARARPAVRRAHARGARGRPLAHRPRAPARAHAPQQGRELRGPRGAGRADRRARSTRRPARRSPARSCSLARAAALGDEDPRGRARGVRQAARRAGGGAGRPGPGRGARAAGRVRRLPHRHVHGLRGRPLRATRRRCSATRARAWSSAAARASRSLPRAITWSRCSRPSAASACTAAAR